MHLSVAQYILCKATKWQIYAAHLSEGLNGCRHVSNNTDMHLVDTLLQRLYAAAAPSACREIFYVNAVRGKLHQLGSPKVAGYLQWEISFSDHSEEQDGCRCHFALKNIYLFLPAGSHR